MHISVFQYDTFRRHARMYLEPSILHKWKIGQEVLLQQLSQEDSIIIGGDMRTDSPGKTCFFFCMIRLNNSLESIVFYIYIYIHRALCK